MLPAPLTRLIPDWLSHYPRRLLGEDVSAGLIVAILSLPQSLAYAMLAGLPPQVGLYVSVLPAIAYAWVGSSMVQAVGPVAVTAIMTLSVLQPLATPGSPEYLHLAASLALLSGAILWLSSLLRLGFLSQLLSRPVTQGFIAGAAILILHSQLRHLLGLSAAETASASSLIKALHDQLSQGLRPAAIIGLCSLAALLLSRIYLPGLLRLLGLPKRLASYAQRLAPLAVVAAAGVSVAAFDLTQQGVSVVGTIAAGLPGWHSFTPDTHTLGLLALPAALMALLGMVQNIAVAQALAIKRRERVHANAELLGLGAANVVAAFSGGMPVGGGVSRSALNVAAGAQTPLATIVTALGVLLILAGLAPLLAQLPLAVLAASIMAAALSMIDLASLRTAWRYDRADALAWGATACGVVFLGLDRGIQLGILLSMASLLVRASSPHIARLGRIAGSEHFRNEERHTVETLPGVLFLRIDENLFFGNVGVVEARLGSEVSQATELSDLVLVMSAVNRIDTTAMEMLRETNQNLIERGIRLHLAEVKGPVHDRLRQASLLSELSGQVFLSDNDAFEILGSRRQAGSV